MCVVCTSPVAVTYRNNILFPRSVVITLHVLLVSFYYWFNVSPSLFLASLLTPPSLLFPFTYCLPHSLSLSHTLTHSLRLARTLEITFAAVENAQGPIDTCPPYDTKTLFSLTMCKYLPVVCRRERCTLERTLFHYEFLSPSNKNKCNDAPHTPRLIHYYCFS